MFVVNRETIDVIANKGGNMEYVPVSVNRFRLEHWDKLRFGSGTNAPSQGPSYTGSSLQNVLMAQNSVANNIPFDSVQLTTKTSINMTDEMPYRA